MWRSDLESNPFPIPPPGTEFSQIPAKYVRCGVYNTPLGKVWNTVAPRILATVEAHGLKFSSLGAVRFATFEDGKEEKLGPAVILIAVLPGTTNAGEVRDATPDILRILSDVQVTDVVVEWREGMVVNL